MPKAASESMELALALVAESLAKYPIDLNRVYITGLSMGGYGTWEAALVTKLSASSAELLLTDGETIKLPSDEIKSSPGAATAASADASNESKSRD